MAVLITTILLILRNPWTSSPSYWAAEIINMADKCTVDPEEAKVHGEGGEKRYEDAWIQFVNGDNTVQVQTAETRLALFFELKPQDAKCFREGSIAPVTIKKCVRKTGGECDFSLSHEVFIRAKKVDIIAWKYAG